MRKKDYCVKCEKEVFYNIKEKKYRYVDKNCKIDYIGKIAICEKCQNEMCVDEVEDYNQEQFEKAYKEKYEIITKEEIEEITKKYNIGKRPLSKILDLGEITITRYLEGYFPTPKNSLLLKNVLHNPDIYYNYLQRNKNKISDVAYKKSLNVLSEMLNFQEDSLLEDVAVYIVQKENVTNLALQKILYYVQVFYYALKKQFMFQSNCNAWDHGPVYGQIYFKYKSFGYAEIEDNSLEVEIEEEQRAVVDAVLKYFGCYTGKVLTYFTHCEEPWKENYSQKKFITNESIQKFAKKLKEKYKLVSLDDIKKYSDDMFSLYQKRTN